MNYTIKQEDAILEDSPLRRVLSALLGGEIDKAPVTSIAGCGGTFIVNSQKNSDFTQIHQDPKKMAELSLISQSLTGIENVRVPFDFVVEPEALGCEIRWWKKPELLPSVKTHPYNTPQDLVFPEKLLEAGRIPIVLQAIKIMRETIGDFLPISSSALGPFSLASELVGIENFLIWTLRKPEYIEAFVNFTTDVVIEYARAQYRAGSNIVQIADAVASLDMISPSIFRRFAKPALAKVAQNIGGIRVLHICGFTEPILSDIAEIGFDGISVEGDIAYAKTIIGKTKILGNISSKKTLVIGAPNDVKLEAKGALEAGVDLLEPECGFSPTTPISNIKAMVEARDEFYM